MRNMGLSGAGLLRGGLFLFPPNRGWSDGGQDQDEPGEHDPPLHSHPHGVQLKRGLPHPHAVLDQGVPHREAPHRGVFEEDGDEDDRQDVSLDGS